MILVDALDPTTLGPAIAYAKARGVPVISTYNQADNARMVVQFNEDKVGASIAAQAVRLLTARYGSPKGQVAVLQGVLGATINATRGGGFTSYLKKYPGSRWWPKSQRTGWRRPRRPR